MCFTTRSTLLQNHFLREVMSLHNLFELVINTIMLCVKQFEISEH